jgi:hypothetical protein
MVALSFPVNPVASLFPYPVGLRDSLTTRSVGVGGDRLHGATGVRLFLAQHLGPTDPDARMSWSSRRRCRPRSTPTRSGPADRPYSSGSISQRPWPGRTCGATRSGRTSPHSYPGLGSLSSSPMRSPREGSDPPTITAAGSVCCQRARQLTYAGMGRHRQDRRWAARGPYSWR